MLRSTSTSAGFATVIWLAFWLYKRGKASEVDSSGRPVLRYLAAPYITFVVATVWLSVGIYQALEPFNHKYLGNMVMLSYIPLAVGALSAALGVYFLSYRAILREHTIEVSRWPFGTSTYRLVDAQSIEAREQDTIVRFSNNRKFVVDRAHSGRTAFLSALSANKSFNPTSLRDAA